MEWRKSPTDRGAQGLVGQAPDQNKATKMYKSTYEAQKRKKDTDKTMSIQLERQSLASERKETGSTPSS